jgi:hypothetical protein
MDTNRLSKQTLQHRPKGRKNLGRQGRDGGTNFILRTKEQEKRLILHEHDNDDDADEFCHILNYYLILYFIFHNFS